MTAAAVLDETVRGLGFVLGFSLFQIEFRSTIYLKINNPLNFDGVILIEENLSFSRFDITFLEPHEKRVDKHFESSN